MAKKMNFDNTMKKVENTAGKVDIIMKNKLIIALFLIVEGVSILLNPAASLEGMARNIIMLVFFAAFLSLVTHLSAKQKDKKSIIISALIVIVSVITYIYPDTISAYIQLLLSLFIIYDGLSNIFNTLHLTKFSGYTEKIAKKYEKIANKKSPSEDVDKGMDEQRDKFMKPIENILSKSNKSTILYLVVNFATVILGILLLVSSYSMVVWGIIFLYTGTSDLIVSMRTMNVASKLKEKKFKEILYGEEQKTSNKKKTAKKKKK